MLLSCICGGLGELVLFTAAGGALTYAASYCGKCFRRLKWKKTKK